LVSCSEAARNSCCTSGKNKTMKMTSMTEISVLRRKTKPEPYSVTRTLPSAGDITSDAAKVADT